MNECSPLLLCLKKNTYNDFSPVTVIPSSAGSFEFFAHPLLFSFLLLLCDLFGRKAVKRKGNEYSVFNHRQKLESLQRGRGV